MYKVIGGGHLTWDELGEILLDIEIQINRRPLMYVEDDVELPTLTPATFLLQRTCQLPEEDPWRIEVRELRKRAKYLIDCKDKLWRRWRKEYLVALRERHMSHKKTKFQPKREDVVIVHSDRRNVDCRRNVPRERQRYKGGPCQDFKRNLGKGSAASISFEAQL